MHASGNTLGSGAHGRAAMLESAVATVAAATMLGAAVATLAAVTMLEAAVATVAAASMLEAAVAMVAPAKEAAVLMWATMASRRKEAAAVRARGLE